MDQAGSWSPRLVVIRRDSDVDDPIDGIVGTKAFVIRDRADAEAARLNELNAGKGAMYFVVVARLQDDAQRQIRALGGQPVFANVTRMPPGV